MQEKLEKKLNPKNTGYVVEPRSARIYVRYKVELRTQL